MTKLTDDQLAVAHAVASARCEKASKIVAAMLWAKMTHPEKITASADRAMWAGAAQVTYPSDETWGCVIRLMEPIRETLWASQHVPKVAQTPLDPGLAVTCPACEGDRFIRPAAWVAWLAAEDEWRRGLTVNLHGPRTYFGPGSPQHEAFIAQHPYPQEPEEIQCARCEGLGTIPTELGEALLSFLRPRFREVPR